MAPSLANSRASDSSDDDDDAAPESVTLNQSRADVKRLDEAKQVAEADAKRKKRERNRLVDENLKKRALETRGTSKQEGATKKKKTTPGRKGKEPEKRSVDEEGRGLEDRMERAMREAQEEEEEEEEEEEGEGEEAVWTGFGDGSESEDSSALGRRQHSDSSSDKEEGISLQSIEEDDDNSMDDAEDESSEGFPDAEPLEEPVMDYLPEHFFSEALSKVQTPSKRKIGSPETSVKAKPEQRRKPVRRRKAKDIVLGSKTLRTVGPNITHNSTAAARTLPPGKIRRFYDYHLSLRSKLSKTRNSWDRRPANIGIMRNNALPAANFVRNS